MINASLVGVVRAALASGRFARVLGALQAIEGVLSGELVDLGAQPAALLERLRCTPSAALGSSRYRLQPDDLERALATLRRHDIHAFVTIGGNDSAETALRLQSAAAQAGYELLVAGVPKTIDNDLPETDHCPGYGSAARFVALAAQEVGLDTWAMRRSDPVRVIEVMGRRAGWLAAASALGKRHPSDPPHLVLLPERPLELDAILAAIERLYRQQGCALVVLSENQPDPSGRVLGAAGEPRYVDPFGHPYFDSPGLFLAEQVQRRLGLRARYDKPGALQKCFSAAISQVDLEEAERCGQAAVALALAGRSGEMVTLLREPGPVYRCATGSAPLASIANRERLLPDHFIAAEGAMPSQAFRDYALPLLGEPLPGYARLDLSLRP